MAASTDNNTPPAELERQKSAFIDKLIEIVRKKEKPLTPETPAGQLQKQDQG